jgi:hypothetical protein
MQCRKKYKELVVCRMMASDIPDGDTDSLANTSSHDQQARSYLQRTVSTRDDGCRNEADPRPLRRGESS